jgi:hypothetical protein
MTVIICANEHDVHWVYDSRLANHAYAYPDTPPGTYWAIVAAFAGEKLELIYFREEGALTPSYADPKWMGILPFLAIDVSTSSVPLPPVADYSEFISPQAGLIKLVVGDYINASCKLDFNVAKFTAESVIKYKIPSVKVLAAIDYAKKLIARSQTEKIDSQRQLDDMYEWIQTTVGDIKTVESVQKTIERAVDPVNNFQVDDQGILWGRVDFDLETVDLDEIF